MKKVWANVVQEIILAILTLGISILQKRRKIHQKKYEETLDAEEAETPKKK